MKLYISFVTVAFVFSALKAKEFTDEEIRMFLPFIRRWVPPPCPVNELYSPCTGKCSDCDQRGRCIVTKCEGGCACAPRFFRVTPDGPCEPVGNCPVPECGENEVFRECGPVCQTCTNVQCHVISCEHECYCREGYLRNTEGKCIPKEQCPIRTRCTRSEEWAESGPVNEFCAMSQDEDLRNKTQDIPGCYCREGYKRNLMGRCVNETMCPKMSCLGGEVFHECVPKCNTTCRNYGNLDCIEDDNCYPGCFCPPGYVMNDLRNCIPVGNCSLDIDQLKIIDSLEIDEDEDTTTTLSVDDDTTTTVTDTTDDAAELNATDNTTVEEMENMTTNQQALYTESPMHETPKSEATVKEIPNKKSKFAKQSETKHENVAKEKAGAKSELSEDENGFGNENI